MAEVSLDVFREYDAVLDSIGLLLHWDEERGYEFDGEDLIVERQDTDQELDQNRLDTLFYGGNRAWHEGANQQRLSMPGASSPYRFLESKGINISEPGEATLLPETSRVLALTNSLPNAPARMVATDSYLFVAVGQPNVKRFSALDASDVVTQSTATETSKEVKDMATDGNVVYVALSGDGTHRSIEPGTTQREAFDSGVWTNNGSGVLNAYDTADKQEGSGALKVTVTDATGGTVEKAFGASQDFSAVDTFRIWVKANRSTAASAMTIRLRTSAGNYFTRGVPALAANTWYEDVSSRLTDWVAVGSPSWSNINSIEINAGWIQSPGFQSATTAIGSSEIPAMTVPINKPSGVTEGDLLLLGVTLGQEVATGTARVVAITGFTLIEVTDMDLGGNIQASLHTFYKVAGPSEPNSYSISCTGTTGAKLVAAAGMARYAGVDPVNPIGAKTENSDVVTPDSSVVASSVTPTFGGAVVVGVYGWADNGAVSLTTTPPVNTIERLERNADLLSPFAETAGIAFSDETQNAATATGSRTTTLTDNVAYDAAQLITLKPLASPFVTHYDDLRSVVAANFAHWSDWDARVLGWAKDRLYAAGVKTGTTWRFFQAASGTGSTEIFVLPEGWEVTDIVEQQGFVYFSAYRGPQGAIYVYDGTNAPFIALRMDPGIIPLSLTPFSGAGLLVGCRRVSSGSAGMGVLLRAFLTASGGLTSEPILEIGSDSSDYGIRCGMQVFDEVYFAWPLADTMTAGLGVYFPDTVHRGAVARHLYGNASRQVTDCAWFKGRRVFTLDGDGVYIEQTSKVTTGQLISSIIDANVAADKLWIVQQSDFSLVDGSAVRHEYSTDGGATWSGFNEATSGSVMRSIVGVKSPRIQYRVSATRGTTASQSPKIFYSGIGGWPAAKPGGTHGLLVKAFPNMETRSGRKIVSPSGGYDLFNQLETRRRNHELLDYQPPWFALSNTALKVRVSRVRFVGPWGVTGDQQGGLIHVVLKEAPPL